MKKHPFFCLFALFTFGILGFVPLFGQVQRTYQPDLEREAGYVDLGNRAGTTPNYAAMGINPNAQRAEFTPSDRVAAGSLTDQVMREAEYSGEFLKLALQRAKLQDASIESAFVNVKGIILRGYVLTPQEANNVAFLAEQLFGGLKKNNGWKSVENNGNGKPFFTSLEKSNGKSTVGNLFYYLIPEKEYRDAQNRVVGKSPALFITVNVIGDLKKNDLKRFGKALAIAELENAPF